MRYAIVTMSLCALQVMGVVPVGLSSCSLVRAAIAAELKF